MTAIRSMTNLYISPRHAFARGAFSILRSVDTESEIDVCVSHGLEQDAEAFRIDLQAVSGDMKRALRKLDPKR